MPLQNLSHMFGFLQASFKFFTDKFSICTLSTLSVEKNYINGISRDHQKSDKHRHTHTHTQPTIKTTTSHELLCDDVSQAEQLWCVTARIFITLQ